MNKEIVEKILNYDHVSINSATDTGIKAVFLGVSSPYRVRGRILQFSEAFLGEGE